MNKITLAGCVKNAPVFSHKILGESFYKFEIDVLRASEQVDTLPCVISETMVSDVEVMDGISLDGEIRTRNWKDSDGKTHMEIVVFVNEVYGYMGTDMNEVWIDGTICKQPYYRKTPLGREICDLLIASNRERGFNSDYLPSIAWGRNARRTSNMEVGKNVIARGRLQSRSYLKKYEDGTSEMKVAYELSLSAVGEREE